MTTAQKQESKLQDQSILQVQPKIAGHYSHHLVIAGNTGSDFCTINLNHPSVSISFGPNQKQWVKQFNWLNLGLVSGFRPLVCEEKCFLPLDSVTVHPFCIVPMGDSPEREKENLCWKSKRKHIFSIVVFILDVMINLVIDIRK